MRELGIAGHVFHKETFAGSPSASLARRAIQAANCKSNVQYLAA